MAHKTLIDGVGYSVTGGKTLVDGTGRKITGGNTLIGGSAYIMKFDKYNSILVDNSWAQIRDACEKNKVPDTWDVGSLHVTYINDEAYVVEVIGKNHDVYADGGIAPLTFQFRSALSADTSYAMHGTASNSYGWSACNMRTNILPNLLAQLETDLADGIKLVRKYTAASGYTSTNVVTNDNLFLPSEAEVFGTYGSNSHAGEGGWYEYYKVNTTTRAMKKVGPDSTIRPDDAAAWWLRSPTRNVASTYLCVSTEGAVTSVQANVMKKISPAFCL